MDLPGRRRQRQLWYSHIGQFAGFIDQQDLVDIGHQLLLVRLERVGVPSLNLGGRFAGLGIPAVAAADRKGQHTAQEDEPLHFTRTFHLFSLILTSHASVWRMHGD